MKISEFLSSKIDGLNLTLEPDVLEKIKSVLTQADESQEMVPYSRLKSKIDEYNTLEIEKKNIQAEIEGLKNNPEVEKLQKEIKTLTKTNEDLVKEKNEFVTKEKNTKFEDALKNSGFNPENFDFIKFKIEKDGELKFENGAFVDLDTKLKALKEDVTMKPFIVETNTETTIGFDPKTNPKGTTKPQYTEEQLSSMTPADMIKLGLV
jgi:hypothetical protein